MRVFGGIPAYPYPVYPHTKKTFQTFENQNYNRTFALLFKQNQEEKACLKLILISSEFMLLSSLVWIQDTNF